MSLTIPPAEEGTILVVDDNADNLSYLSNILERAGYKVLPALSGEVALRVIAINPPDLVLLDIRMQGLDGYETCKRLKAGERTKEIPVIFISALNEPSDRVAAFDAGGVDYVTKPFFADEVLGRVRTHVQLNRIKRNLEAQVLIRTSELAESEARLHQLSIFLQKVREEDRAHFARELHDELGQNLTALRMDFNRLENNLGTIAPAIKSQLASIDSILKRTVDSTRRICEDLRPGMLDDLGLEAALSSYVKRFNRQFDVVCDLSLDRVDYGLTDPIATTIFRIVQESLTNIGRHSRAANALVAMRDKGHTLVLTIADDGCGIPAESKSERKTYGILGMRERVNMLGGTMEVDSESGRGTHIEFSIPRRIGEPCSCPDCR